MIFADYDETQELCSRIEQYADIRDALSNLYLDVSTEGYKHYLTITTSSNLDNIGVPMNRVLISAEDKGLLASLIAIITRDITSLQEEYEDLTGDPSV